MSYEHKPLTRKRPLKKCECGQPRKRRLSRCKDCKDAPLVMPGLLHNGVLATFEKK